MKFFLNGKQITPPLEGMRYKTIPAIDPGALLKGKNVLTTEITPRNRRKKKQKTPPSSNLPFQLKMHLKGLIASDLKLQTGPILGTFGEDYFTVTVRTNIPCSVSLCFRAPSLKVPRVVTSPRESLIHRFRVRRHTLKGGLEYWFICQSTPGPGGPEESEPITVTTRRWSVQPRSSKTLRFAVLGDSRTNPGDWARVAAAVAKSHPQFVVFGGDMVEHGRRDWEWDEEFCGVAKDFFATIPFYAVIGNHERNAPLYDELFYTPTADGRGRNWMQLIGEVALIGIDGKADWSVDSENAKWLETQLLRTRNAKFIFLITHYPAWTSSAHGKLNQQGIPKERPVLQGRNVIMPLLIEHRATAMIAGHDHVYERSEPPGGVTHIISGGAGAPLRRKSKSAAKQNPHSKVFASRLHYCLFEVDAGKCTMKVLTPQGELLDTKTWVARKSSNAPAPPRADPVKRDARK